MVVLPPAPFAAGLPSTNVAVRNGLWIVSGLDVLGRILDGLDEVLSNHSVIGGEVFDPIRFRSGWRDDVKLLGTEALDSSH